MESYSIKYFEYCEHHGGATLSHWHHAALRVPGLILSLGYFLYEVSHVLATSLLVSSRLSGFLASAINILVDGFAKMN